MKLLDRFWVQYLRLLMKNNQSLPFLNSLTTRKAFSASRHLERKIGIIPKESLLNKMFEGKALQKRNLLRLISEATR